MFCLANRVEIFNWGKTVDMITSVLNIKIIKMPFSIVLQLSHSKKKGCEDDASFVNSRKRMMVTKK